jgi:perosamine synthetase
VLGLCQLRKLPGWVERRQEIARIYNDEFDDIPEVNPLTVNPEVSHAYHIYMIQVDTNQLRIDRSQVYKALIAEGIGVNVHYIPVHLHPYYQEYLGTGYGDCPVAEAVYQRLITLPIFPQMTNEDVFDVIKAINKVIKAYKK